MIKEYDCDPNYTYDIDTGKQTLEWAGKLTVDLTWVATAAPWHGSKKQSSFTTISMSGCQYNKVINVPYEQFRNLWMRVEDKE